VPIEELPPPSAEIVKLNTPELCMLARTMANNIRGLAEVVPSQQDRFNYFKFSLAPGARDIASELKRRTDRPPVKRRPSNSLDQMAEVTIREGMLVGVTPEDNIVKYLESRASILCPP
jgi:hypothetical protein